MRAETILRSLLGIDQIVVKGFSVENGALVIGVRPTWRTPRCSGCGRKTDAVHDVHRGRSWRHLDFGGVEVVLRYDVCRVKCRKCGVLVEKVPWTTDTVARFTRDFDDQVAYHAQRTDKTAVQHMFNIAWRTVGTIIERVVSRLRPKDPLAKLTAIGIDEISFRKHHHYITFVSDHDTRRIVWGKEGKDAATLAAFFEQLGEERCKQIEVVTMDMSGAFIKTVRDKLPHAQIVFDRFHVHQLVSEALDKTRREEWQRARGTPDAGGLKHLRWPLLKNSWDLRSDEKEKLSALQSVNKRVYRAYLLKESFATILDGRQIHVVERKLREWIAWAVRSQLPSFAKVSRTIREHFDNIIAYVRWGLSNGHVEGLNTKTRLLTRRAYGFHSADAVIAMVMLCCTGLTLEPIRKRLNAKPATSTR